MRVFSNINRESHVYTKQGNNSIKNYSLANQPIHINIHTPI